MASKQFTLLSAEEAAQQFDNPTSYLHHVLDKVINWYIVK